jgi:hypothetical protein
LVNGNANARFETLAIIFELEFPLSDSVLVWDFNPKSKKNEFKEMLPNDAGFELFINVFDGKAMPKPPKPFIFPVLVSLLKPKPYSEYGELESKFV